VDVKTCSPRSELFIKKKKKNVDVKTCSPRHCSQELPMPVSHYNSSSSLDMLSYCNEDCQDILCISDLLYLIDHPLLSYMEELKQSIADMVHCQAMGDHSL
jgi:hypothetical protein